MVGVLTKRDRLGDSSDVGGGGTETGNRGEPKAVNEWHLEWTSLFQAEEVDISGDNPDRQLVALG